jgi:hypothetical protein
MTHKSPHKTERDLKRKQHAGNLEHETTKIRNEFK